MIEVDVHPEFAAVGTFAHLPLGRRAAFHDPRTLRLADYIDAAVLLPEIPAEADWTGGVPSWPMYGNNSLGDCTLACVGHMIQAWTAAAGRPVTPEEAAMIAAYWATGSGDDGRFEVDILNYWRNSGIAGDRLGSYAYLDAQNLDHVRAAIYLFGGVYTGIALPQSAQGQPVWDVVGDGKTGPAAPGSWGGHAVPYLAYDGGGFKTVTWGSVLALTNAFHLAYCDELYVLISPDFLSAQAGNTPAGFDIAQLEADVIALTREPDPAPAPGGGFTWNG
jgi:hypothetical protein